MGNINNEQTLLGYFKKEAKNIKERQQLVFDKRDKNKKVLDDADYAYKSNTFFIDNNRYVKVNLIENIDVKNVSKNNKCFVKFENGDGSYIEIPFLDYRAKM